jgi:glycosyltransferase involved in cell wall biosynthesis
MSAEGPLVGIVVPAYNAARFLPHTIDSILAQTYTNWCVVIVDDGSTDATSEIAREASARDRRFSLAQQQNQGTGAARETGYGRLPDEAQFVVFLDSDDTWEPDTLQTLVSALAASPEMPAAYGYCRYVDELGKPVRLGHAERCFSNRRLIDELGNETSVPAGEPTTFECMLTKNSVITPGSMLVRREALQKAGVYEAIHGLPECVGEDRDLWLRVALLGPLKTVDRLVLNYRAHAQNTTKKRWLMNMGDYYVRLKYALGPVALTPHQRYLARILLDKNLAEFQRNSLEALDDRARHYLRAARRRILTGKMREGLRYLFIGRQYARRRDLLAAVKLEPDARLLNQIMAPELFA